jgi:hypothetical protein
LVLKALHEVFERELTVRPYGQELDQFRRDFGSIAAIPPIVLARRQGHVAVGVCDGPLHRGLEIRKAAEAVRRDAVEHLDALA